jgi:hypothetical protein
MLSSPAYSIGTGKRSNLVKTIKRRRSEARPNSRSSSIIELKSRVPVNILRKSYKKSSPLNIGKKMLLRKVLVPLRETTR